MIYTESAAYMINTDDDEERNRKQKEFLDEFNEHIQNIYKVFNMYFKPILDDLTITFDTTLFSMEDFRNAIKTVEINLQTHDGSKLSDEEFEAYRLSEKPTKAEENDPLVMDIARDKLQDAKVHHYANNSHHPEYWVDKETGRPIDMELDGIIEMLVDWIAEHENSVAVTKEWYETKCEDKKKIMTDYSKRVVEFLLNNLTDLS